MGLSWFTLISRKSRFVVSPSDHSKMTLDENTHSSLDVVILTFSLYDPVLGVFAASVAMLKSTGVVRADSNLTLVTAAVPTVFLCGDSSSISTRVVASFLDLILLNSTRALVILGSTTVSCGAGTAFGTGLGSTAPVEPVWAGVALA